MGAVLSFQPMARPAKSAWLDAVMSRTDLSPGAKLTAWALVRHHNDQTGQCNPSAARLALVAGLTVRGVQKALAGLVAAGLVLVIGAVRGRGSNGYILAGDTNHVRNTDANAVPVDSERGSGHSEHGSYKPVNNQILNLGAGKPACVQAGQNQGREAVADAGPLSRLRAVLARMKGETWVARWAAGLALVGCDGGRVRLAVPSPMIRDHLDGTAGVELRRAAGVVWPDMRSLSVEVAPL